MISYGALEEKNVSEKMIKQIIAPIIAKMIKIVAFSCPEIKIENDRMKINQNQNNQSYSLFVCPNTFRLRLCKWLLSEGWYMIQEVANKIDYSIRSV